MCLVVGLAISYRENRLLGVLLAMLDCDVCHGLFAGFDTGRLLTLG